MLEDETHTRLGGNCAYLSLVSRQTRAHTGPSCVRSLVMRCQRQFGVEGGGGELRFKSWSHVDEHSQHEAILD